MGKIDALFAHTTKHCFCCVCGITVFLVARVTEILLFVYYSPVCYKIAGSSVISLTVHLSTQVYLIVSMTTAHRPKPITNNWQMTDVCLGVTSKWSKEFSADKISKLYYTNTRTTTAYYQASLPFIHKWKHKGVTLIGNTME